MDNDKESANREYSELFHVVKHLLIKVSLARHVLEYVHPRQHDRWKHSRQIFCQSSVNLRYRWLKTKNACFHWFGRVYSWRKMSTVANSKIFAVQLHMPCIDTGSALFYWHFPRRIWNTNKASDCFTLLIKKKDLVATEMELLKRHYTVAYSEKTKRPSDIRRRLLHANTPRGLSDDTHCADPTFHDPHLYANHTFYHNVPIPGTNIASYR